MLCAVVVQEIFARDRPEDEEHSGQPLEVGNNQLRAVIEADPLTPTWKISHLKQTGKVKNLLSRCLMSLSRKSKRLSFEVSSLILCNNKPFLNWIVMSDKKWTHVTTCSWPAQWLDQKPQSTSKTVLKEGHGHFPGLLWVWPTTAFWLQKKPLHLRNMLSKLRCTKMCFEPSNNDLKFMVWNHNYICTNQMFNLV